VIDLESETTDVTRQIPFLITPAARTHPTPVLLLP